MRSAASLEQVISPFVPVPGMCSLVRVRRVACEEDNGEGLEKGTRRPAMNETETNQTR